MREEYRDLNSNSEELNDFEINNNPAKDFFYFLFDLMKTGFIVFLLAFSLRYFVIQPFIVDGESMMPNFVNNEYLLAEKVSYMLHEPKRGDVVVFRYPGNPNVNYIKRVIGLPGETVQIEENKVTIINKDHPDGMVLNESYLSSTSKTMTPDRDAFEKVLRENEYFVMGDNRQHSSDSREWGALPEMNIIGRAWLTIAPVSRFKLHTQEIYNTLSNITFYPIARPSI